MKSFKQFMAEAKFELNGKSHDATDFFGSDGVRGILDPTDPTAPKEDKVAAKSYARVDAMSNTRRTARTPPPTTARFPSDIIKRLKGTAKPSAKHDRIWEAHPLGGIGSYLHKEIGMNAYEVHEHLDNVFDYVKYQEKKDNELGIKFTRGTHILDGLHDQLFGDKKLQASYRALMGKHYKESHLAEKWLDLTGSIARAAIKSAGLSSTEEDADDIDQEDDERFDGPPGDNPHA